MTRAAISRSYPSWLNVSFVIIAVDQLSKWAVKRAFLSSYRLCSWFCINPVCNRGVSWGLGRSLPYANTLFLLLSLCLVAWVTAQAIKGQGQGATTWMYGLIIGGAFSNGIDRFLYGSVFDFIMLHWATLYWPIFNIADIAIVGGILLLLLKET